MAYSGRAPLRTAFGRPVSSRGDDSAIVAWLFVLLAMAGLVVIRLATRSIDADIAGGHSLARTLGYGVSQRIPLGYDPNAPSPPPSGVTPVPPPPLQPPVVADAEASAPSADTAPAPDAGQRYRVANTDGVGVVLHTAPRQDARVPRGLLEGTRVTVLERSDDEWAHVRADNRLEGWVPLKYLTPSY
jgi:hypothetical protein